MSGTQYRKAGMGRPRRMILVLLSMVLFISSFVSCQDAVAIEYQDLERFAFERGIGRKGGGEQVCDATPVPAEDLVESIERAFGPEGLGIVEITNIPADIVELRNKLLPMARSMANLPAQELDGITLPEKFYAIGWSHGREQLKDGKYDFDKGSFYMNLFDGDRFLNRTKDTADGPVQSINVFPPSLQPSLEKYMDEMNRFMGKAGLWIAKLCDEYMLQSGRENATNGSEPPKSIYESLETCFNCKARLLHYFPMDDDSERSSDPDSDDEWCGWHTDHGSLTALLPGMYIDGAGNKIECHDDEEKRSDELCSGREKSGLHIRNSSGEVVRVSLAETSLGFQIGETVTIMTRGRLRATPHAVKAAHGPGISRESLALFLQPEPQEPLPALANDLKNGDDRLSLESRWRPTFGEFQLATLAAFN